MCMYDGEDVRVSRCTLRKLGLGGGAQAGSGRRRQSADASKPRATGTTTRHEAEGADCAEPAVRLARIACIKRRPQAPTDRAQQRGEAAGRGRRRQRHRAGQAARGRGRRARAHVTCDLLIPSCSIVLGPPHTAYLFSASISCFTCANCKLHRVIMYNVLNLSQFECLYVAAGAGTNARGTPQTPATVCQPSNQDARDMRREARGEEEAGPQRAQQLAELRPRPSGQRQSSTEHHSTACAHRTNRGQAARQRSCFC